MKVDRENLRVWEDLLGIHREVSDAELSQMGWLKRPQKAGDPSLVSQIMEQWVREAGYVRLDVDVEALRDLVVDHDDGWPMTAPRYETLISAARQVLAALDGETT